ncbi:hypothetical protein D3C86_2105330 [compost metagenome]
MIKLAQDRVGGRELPALLKRYGMPDAEADAVSEELKEKSNALGQDLILVMIMNQSTVFEPLEELAK